MKKIIVSLLLLLATAGYAQKKQNKKEKTPTQNEMQQMMEEAKGMMGDMMKEMSDEDKKMMDSLGVKMPDMKNAAKNLSGISNKQLADAWEDENRIVPQKDAARIASIPKPVADTDMAAYITAIQSKSAACLKPENKLAAEKIHAYIQTKRYNSHHAGSMAIALWLYGKPQSALYLLGKICANDAANTDNISNYAAMLSMQGGQHLSIPLLNNLNRKFKWNSTLLNNLGQAWFGLGDIDRADKYLDSAIALYPYHPQANLTKAAIEESKGNLKKAEEAIKKSIKHAYTPEKEAKLKKLGYKLKYADLYIRMVRKGDPLELGKIRRPDYPFSVEEANSLYPQWKGFIADCELRITKLQAELPKASVGYMTHASNTAKRMMNDVRNGAIPSVNLVPLFAREGALGATRTTEYFEQKVAATLVPNGLKRSKGLDSIRKNAPIIAPEEPCSVHQQAKSELIKKLNTFRKFYDDEFLEEYRHYLSDMGHWALLTSTDPHMLRAISIEYQISWLKKNIEFKPEFEGISEVHTALCEKEPEKKTYTKLQDFDNTDACKYKSKIEFSEHVSLKINCTTTTWDFKTEFLDYSRTLGPNDEYKESRVVVKPKIGASGNAGPLKAGASLGGEITVNMDTKGVKDWNAVVKAEAQLGVGTSVGPVSTEATVSTAVELEINEKGITRADFTTKAEAKLGIEAPKLEGEDALDKSINTGIDKVNDKLGDMTSVDIGVENRVSLISGSNTRSGTGVLSGITFK